ncbi:MAG: efflux RND transporter periplasmic adaptor subunit [Deltaproteobacteria bacterium]|nr:efflux RND transporter periplasmic adaptor subunit [Deltaproteobacteria bacterium]
MKKLDPKLSLPLITLVVGFVAAGGMIATSPSVKTQKPERLLPLVRVQEATPEHIQLTVKARGTVAPRTQSDLVAEVSGRIVEVSPSLASGGFVEPDDVLVRIDPRDYEIALVRAEASLARAQSDVELARSSLGRHNHLRERGVDSDSAHEAAVNAAHVAEAMVRDAEANLLQAQRDLERTHVRAPFAGRIRTKHVDVGQFVSRGAPVALIYAVDYAEVRLPLPDADAAFVDLPIAYRGHDADEEGPVVVLRARFAGRLHTWRGRIVRTEGELDPRTRMIHAVARVEDPYGRGDDPDRPPLSVGLFVEAEILGLEVDDVYVLPRSALRGSDRVAVVDAEGVLTLRPVVVLKRNRDTIVIESGLAAGDLICTSPLPVSVEGMKVRTMEMEREPRRAHARATAGNPRAAFAGDRSTP